MKRSTDFNPNRNGQNLQEMQAIIAHTHTPREQHRTGLNNHTFQLIYAQQMNDSLFNSNRNSNNSNNNSHIATRYSTYLYAKICHYTEALLLVERAKEVVTIYAKQVQIE